MNLFGCLNIIKMKIFRNKKNHYIILQFIICAFLLLLFVNFRFNFTKLINNNLSKNIGFRSLSVIVDVSEEDLGEQKLRDLEHVIAVYSSKYDTYTVESSYKSDNLDGYIDLVYTEDSIVPDILYGNSISTQDTGVAICPLNFYPTSEAYNLIINQNEVLNGSNLIGTTFSVEYNSYSYDENESIVENTFFKEFKIVGIYDSESNMSTANTCYISASDMIEMKDKSNNTSDDIENSMNYNFVVVVDNIDNVTQVQEEILEIGFLGANIRSELDYSIINVIIFICNFVIVLISFAIIILAISYMKKKHIYEQNFSGILRSQGYTKKQILIINVTEQFILNILSFMLGTFVFILIFFPIKYIFLSNYILFGLSIEISFSSFIYSFAIMVILTTLIDFFLLLKSINKRIILEVRSEA